MKTAINNLSTLAGKKVVILGGSSGLGLATAKAAAREDARVIIVSGNQERIDAALKELPANADGFAIDLSKAQNIKTFLSERKTLTIWSIQPGGSISRKTIADLNMETARNYFLLRFWGPFAAAKYGSPHINKGGSITFTSGIASPRPGIGWSLGASTSGAMEGFTRAMAIELAPIRVNIVSPGVVKTNLWADMSDADRENLYQNLGNAMLVKRVGEPEDIAQTYIYLMKQQFGTGQVVIVDGGAVMV